MKAPGLEEVIPMHEVSETGEFLYPLFPVPCLINEPYDISCLPYMEISTLLKCRMEHEIRELDWRPHPISLFVRALAS